MNFECHGFHKQSWFTLGNFSSDGYMKFGQYLFLKRYTIFVTKIVNLATKTYFLPKNCCRIDFFQPFWDKMCPFSLISDLNFLISRMNFVIKHIQNAFSLNTDIFFPLYSIVLIKTSSVVEADKKIVSQVRVMNLNDASPYETLHSYVSSAVAPYFKSYVRETGRAER